MQIRAPTRCNRKLEALLAAANSDDQLKAWWHLQQTTATRLGMSDHSWVHIQIVLNLALRLFRLLSRNIEPAIVRDHGMSPRDGEVVIAAACLLHDAGMSIHRSDHEAYSLFVAADKLGDLLRGAYDEPERSVVAADVLHAIIGHRSKGAPLTPEAGIVRVADGSTWSTAGRGSPSRRDVRTSTPCRRRQSRKSVSCAGKNDRSESRSR